MLELGDSGVPRCGKFASAFPERELVWSRRLAIRLGSAMLCCGILVLAASMGQAQSPGLREAMDRVVKLYGAGGVGRVEAYGTGIVVSPQGHLLTHLTPLLEAETLRVVFHDGRRLDAKMVVSDPVRELAVLKVDADGLAHFDLANAPISKPGDVVWALSNAFNVAAGEEPASLQRGVVAAVANLAARQGVQQFAYGGKVYVVDANTNNPGAAGGALMNSRGQLLGLIGKELQNTLTETWVNYALPVAEFRPFVDSVIAGKHQPITPNRKKVADRPDRWAKTPLRGIILLPEVLERTPAFVDEVEQGSPAAKAGMKPDDLVLFVDDILIQSVRDLRAAFASSPANAKIRLIVRRDDALHTVELAPLPETKP